MAYPPGLLDEIKSKTNLVELVQRQVALKPRGKNWVGLCPFHSETKPSFNVNPAMGIYKCFGCEESGNAFGWLQRTRGMSFTEAVTELADAAGVEVPEVEGRANEHLTLNDSVAVLQGLGVTRIVLSDNKVKAPCPLSKWRHEKETDERPSFAVLRSSGGRLVGRCLACHFKGSMERLVLAVQFLSGQNLSKLMEVVGPQDQTMASRLARMDGQGLTGGVQEKLSKIQRDAVLAWDSVTGLNKVPLDDIEYEVMPDSEIESYMGSVPRYALERGLELSTCQEWRLGHNKRDRRLVFPVWNHRHELVGMTSRKYVDSAWGPKYLHSRGKWRSMVFYGEDHLSDRRYAVLVEGTFDVLMVRQAGVGNVLGMLGSWLGKVQRQKLEEWFDEIIIIPDGDKAGRDMAERVKKELPSLDVHVAATPEQKDPADLEPEVLLDLIEQARPGLSLTFPGSLGRVR